MNQSQSIAGLSAALAKANAEFGAVKKDRTNPHFKSKYATLDSIMDAVRTALAKHGLAVMQGASESTNGFVITTRLVHSSGEWVENVVPVPVSKQDAQGVGSALTYGRRYGVSALLAIATDEDDDGNAASKPAPKAEPKPEAKPAKSPTEVVLTAADLASVTPWDGTDHDALSYIWPLEGSKHKGKKMGDIPADDLRKFVEWAGVKPQYLHLVNRANAILGATK